MSAGIATTTCLGSRRYLSWIRMGLRPCLDGRKYVDRVRTESEYADDNGITSTPWVLINGERVRGVEYGIFRDAIEAALAATQ